MKYLFEGISYSDSVYKKYLPQGAKMRGGKPLKYIGYCSMWIEDEWEHVFMLPKVFVNHVDGKDAAFGKEICQDEPLDDAVVASEAISEVMKILPSWLGRALHFYQDRKPKSDIVKETDQEVLSSSGDLELSPTLYQRIYALEDFYLKNKDLALTIYREAHSAYNKINWGRTIRTCQPFIEQDSAGYLTSVVYLNMVSRKKTINRNEQLMSLFFNTLEYVNEKYHFEISTSDCLYELMPPDEFKDCVESGQILSTLQEIKNQYFSDTLVQLWEVLHSFHEREQEHLTHAIDTEYLLVSKFEAVFEDMIDNLVNDDVLYTDKHQADDKRIDHIFLAKSLFDPQQQIYYIGDSKYYAESNEIDGSSVGKQFTYATNVIQDAMGKRNSENDDDRWARAYYDDVTRGYNVIPNFFIRGKYDKNNRFDDDVVLENVEKGDTFKEEQAHFKECLFDRSTSFLTEYSINFLFVLKNYNEQSSFAKDEVKKALSKAVYRDFIERLDALYEFRVYMGLREEHIYRNYRYVLGKIMKFGDKYIVALRKDENIDAERETIQRILGVKEPTTLQKLNGIESMP